MALLVVVPSKAYKLSAFQQSEIGSSYDPRNDDFYSHSDRDVMNFAKAISSGNGFYDAAEAASQKQSEMLELEQASNPYFLALDASEMSDFKAPKKENDEDIDVSELVQLKDTVKNGTAAAQTEKPKDEKAAEPAKQPSVKETEKPAAKQDDVKKDDKQTATKEEPAKPEETEKAPEKKEEPKPEKPAEVATKTTAAAEQKPPTNNENIQTKSSMKTGVKHIEEIMNDKEGEQIGQDLIEKAKANSVSSLERELPVKEDADDMSFTEAGKLHKELESGKMDNVISTHIESVEDLFGSSEKKELSDAYSKAGIKEPEKSNAEKQKEMAQEGLGALVDMEADEQSAEQKVEKKEAKDSKNEEAKPAEEKKIEEQVPEESKDRDQQKLEQLSNMLDEENQASGADPTEPRASVKAKTEDAPKEEKPAENATPDEPEQQAQPAVEESPKVEQPAPEAPVQQQAEAQANVPSQNDIGATLDAYIAQQTAAGHDVDITKIDPEVISQLMNGQQVAQVEPQPAAQLASTVIAEQVPAAQSPQDIVSSTIALMKAQQAQGDMPAADALGAFTAVAAPAPTVVPEVMPVFQAPAEPEPVDEADDDGPKLSDADQFEKDTTSLTNANAETTSQMQQFMADQAKLVTPAPALPQEPVVPTNPEGVVTPEEQQAVNAIIMGVDPAQAAKSVVESAHVRDQALAPVPPIATSQINTAALNLMPIEPQNGFAAALEKQIGPFAAAELPSVTAPAPLSVAELTHRAVQNALAGNSDVQPAAMAEAPAVAPAEPMLALPSFGQQAPAALPTDQAQLEALATAQAQAELSATPGQPVSLDQQLAAAMSTQTALGITSQNSAAIAAPTVALDEQLKASMQAQSADDKLFNAQSEALDKADQPKWEQDKKPENELTEEQKLESLLDPSAAAFQNQVAGGSLFEEVKPQPIQALPQQTEASGLVIDQLYGSSASQNLNQASEANAAVPDLSSILAAAQAQVMPNEQVMAQPLGNLGLSNVISAAQSLGQATTEQDEPVQSLAAAAIAATPTEQVQASPLTSMVMPAINDLGDAGKIQDLSGGLKSFDELPGSTIAPSLNTASVAQLTDPTVAANVTSAPEVQPAQSAPQLNEKDEEAMLAPPSPNEPLPSVEQKPTVVVQKRKDVIGGVKIPEIETAAPEEKAQETQPEVKLDSAATQSLVVTPQSGKPTNQAALDALDILAEKPEDQTAADANKQAPTPAELTDKPEMPAETPAPMPEPQPAVMAAPVVEAPVPVLPVAEPEVEPAAAIAPFSMPQLSLPTESAPDQTAHDAAVASVFAKLGITPAA